MPTGSIRFFLNGIPAGSAAVAQGQASVPILIQGGGVVVIRAVYSGDANYGSSSAFLQLTSSLVSTTTTLSSSASSLAQGAGVTFTANVSPVTATGTVTFLDGTTALGTATLNAGVATYMSKQPGNWFSLHYGDVWRRRE